MEGWNREHPYQGCGDGTADADEDGFELRHRARANRWNVSELTRLMFPSSDTGIVRVVQVFVPTIRRLAMRHPLLLFLALFAAAPPAFAQQGTITGTVVDTGGDSVVNAQVTLSLDGRAPDQETQSTVGGEFSFANVTPGRYHLTFTADGFAVKTIAGDVHPGETVNLPPIALAIATFTTELNVTPTQVDRLRLRKSSGSSVSFLTTTPPTISMPLRSTPDKSSS